MVALKNLERRKNISVPFLEIGILFGVWKIGAYFFEILLLQA